MNSEITMNVSALSGDKENPSVFVQFRDGEKEIEIKAPEGKVVKNNGFNDEEIEQLFAFVDGNREYILSIAKKVNPLNGFLGKRQGCRDEE